MNYTVYLLIVFAYLLRVCLQFNVYMVPINYLLITVLFQMSPVGDAAVLDPSPIVKREQCYYGIRGERGRRNRSRPGESCWYYY